MKISIIIPAHNEEDRIGKTLESYCHFFNEKQADGLSYELVIVLNGCSDNTLPLVQEMCKKWTSIAVIDLKQSGKGFAVQHGFKDALKRDNDLIGFVDADMSTEPEAFYDLIQSIGQNDGIIASRYMKDSQIFPPRPRIKRWGSQFIYEPLVYCLFGLRFSDFQCGAKLFTRQVIKTIIPYCATKWWGFDVELLYLCKKYNFVIREIPTQWYDKTGSKLSMLGGIGMLGSLFRIRLRHTDRFR